MFSPHYFWTSEPAPTEILCLLQRCFMVEVTCPTPKSQVADLGVLLSPCGGLLCTPAMQIGPGETLPFYLEQRTQEEKVSSGMLLLGPCVLVPVLTFHRQEITARGANTW